MKKISFIIILLLSAALLLCLPACSPAGDAAAAPSARPSENGYKTVTDIFGRTVELPNTVGSIVCTGNGALRMVSYLGALDMLTGVEDGEFEYASSAKRDYAYVYSDELASLPVIGSGGGSAYTAYPEEIISIAPDVIISCYTQDAAEQLQSETGIPVVCVQYKSQNFIDDSFYTALTILGDVLGKEDRCSEILDFIDGCKADLDARTRGIPENEKPRVYTGAVTFSGAHGFAGTYANFGPFLAVNALNVADVTGESGAFDADLEMVVEWDPDIIFLDPGNMDLVNSEYASNPNYFNSLSAVQSGEIYTMPSFNNYSTNITYAIIDAYYAGTVLCPEEFKDVDIAERSDEILTFFLGRGYYNDMAEQGLGFGKLTLGE